MPTRKPWMRAKPVTSVVRVALLELVEARAVHEPRDDLAHVVRLAQVRVDDAVDLRADRRADLRAPPCRRGSCFTRFSVETIVRAWCSACVVVLGEVIGDAGEPRVHVGAAELLGGDFLAGRGLHQRRAAEEDRAGAFDDDRLVRHRRHVGAAGRARAHHDGDLRNALGRHPRLVEEDAAEVLAIGEDLGLQRQERAARVDQVDAGQPVLQRDFLRAQVLLHRQRIVGAALDGRVVGDDQHLAARRRGRRPVTMPAPGASSSYMLPRGQRRQLEERRARIEQPRRSARAPAACPARDAARGTSRRRPRARARPRRAIRRRAPPSARVGAGIGARGVDVRRRRRSITSRSSRS